MNEDTVKVGINKKAIKIGFIGAGYMGYGMAHNLLKNSFSVSVIAHKNRKPIERLLEEGAIECKSLKELGENNNVMFLPDHDTWEETLDLVGYDNPLDWFSSLDASIVLLDGTFWDDNELKNRVQSQVPHPTVNETIKLLGKRKEGDPRIIFVHLNHTNPLHYTDSDQYQKLHNMGWEVGEEGMEFLL